MRRRGCLLSIVVVLVVSSLAPVALGRPTMEVVSAPELVIANPSENMTQDNFNPDYVFTATARITNDDTERQINAEAIFYTDPSVDGCPRDEQAFPVAFVVKNRQMEPGEELTIGGAARPSQAQGDAYWPMAISRAYSDGQETIRVEQGEHTFCTTIRVSGNDPACDKPANRTCVIATDSFTSFVRRSNAAPEITEFSIGDETPRPGQQVLFRAEARDADTEPAPDEVRYTWTISREEKTGKVVRHTFDVATTHRVALTVTDGFDEATRETTIEVTTTGGGGSDGGQDAPAPSGVVALAPLVGAALIVRARSRR